MASSRPGEHVLGVPAVPPLVHGDAPPAGPRARGARQQLHHGRRALPLRRRPGRPGRVGVRRAAAAARGGISSGRKHRLHRGGGRRHRGVGVGHEDLG
eukprot:CAMPEP_0179364278 /NCGR_PEP_ID=MMETSP0797-20121207/81962_1 /TAXON_ID=47934 /ORGANISM="Dinophysis acuminata, Strain DAEP01" /LENGTH=97 /DNA_ID=CAMNT_0021079763 /DNA_START=33 /DNA_END=323 /DNA_ORIENTATION=-